MKYDFHINDAIRVEYRLTTDGPSFPRGYAQIERETRAAGGNGVVAACALAKWGANVLLTGNAVGDDSHGQLIGAQLSQVPNLTYEAQVQPGLETPYAILLQAGTHGIGTLLSASASRIELPKRSQNSQVAGFFFGAPSSFGEEGTSIILRAPSQDYEALLGSLEAVSACYLSLLGDDVGADEKEAFTACVVGRYKTAFGGIETIPTIEEIEAFLSVER
jgi:hypothetical protein